MTCGRSLWGLYGRVYAYSLWPTWTSEVTPLVIGICSKNSSNWSIGKIQVWPEATFGFITLERSKNSSWAEMLSFRPRLVPREGTVSLASHFWRRRWLRDVVEQAGHSRSAPCSEISWLLGAVARWPIFGLHHWNSALKMSQLSNR